VDLHLASFFRLEGFACGARPRRISSTTPSASFSSIGPQVADQQPGLPAPELLLDALSVDLDREGAAELDPDLICQVAPRYGQGGCSTNQRAEKV
jgi:hypothetical protein